MSTSDALWAVVPVKLFAHAKQRLLPLLTADERAALSRAMLGDVLAALTCTPALAGVVVMTGDTGAAAMAQAAGACVLADTENAGITAAVEQAARHLAGEGRHGMLVIPADVPLITPADVGTIVNAHRAAPAVTLVAASMDGGTNALACSPPRALAFGFGDDSLRHHREAARARGIEPQILALARVGHDIDRPDDVATFLMHPSATRSYACLRTLGIAERLGRAQRARCNEPCADY